MKGFGSHLLGMGSKVYLIEHLDADELYHRYREEQDPIKRTHLQILWLLTSGRPAKVAAEMTGYSSRTTPTTATSRWCCPRASRTCWSTAPRHRGRHGDEHPAAQPRARRSTRPSPTSRTRTITTDELIQHIKGPDFPTGGIILGLAGIRDAYDTGRGRVRVRAPHIEPL